MATSLASQLVAVAQRNQALNFRRTRKRYSLLFSPEDAADLDNDYIYSLAANGLQELALLDPTFLHFEAALFSEVVKAKDRELMVQEELNKLNRRIDSFLQRVSPFFLHKATAKTLEWLIRHFRIQDFNVESILKCSLVYHETQQFAKLISICTIREDSRWAFLRELRNNPKPVQLRVLVRQCVKDVSLVEFSCDMVKSAAREQSLHTSLVTFQAALLIQYIQAVPKVTEKIMVVLLPHIIHGLAYKKNSEYQVATYMVVSQLAARATLSGESAAALVDNIIRNCSPRHLSEAILCVVHLYQSQELLTDFNRTALANLLKNGESVVESLLIDILRNFSVDRFLAMFVTRLVRSLAEYEKALGLFCGLLSAEASQLNYEIMLSACNLLIREITDAGELSERKASNLKKALLTLQNRHPDIVDGVLRKTMDSSKSDDGLHSRLFEFVTAAFRGTSHELLEDSTTTLYLAVHHADPATRILGLKKIDALLKNGDSGAQVDFSFVSDSLLARLVDDDSAVVAQALTTCKLDSVIADKKTLLGILGRHLLPTKIETSWSRKQIELVQVRAITFLTGDFKEVLETLSPAVDEQQDILRTSQKMLLAHLLDCGYNSKVARIARSGSERFTTAVMRGVASETSACLDAAAANRKLCETLSDNIYNAGLVDDALALFDDALKGQYDTTVPSFSTLAVLVTNRLLHLSVNDPQALLKIAERLTNMLASWDYAQPMESRSSKVASMVSEGLPNASLLADIARGDGDGAAKKELYVLVNLLRLVKRPTGNAIAWLTPIDHGTPTGGYRAVVKAVATRIASAPATSFHAYKPVLKVLFAKHMEKDRLEFLVDFCTADGSALPEGAVNRSLKLIGDYVTELKSGDKIVDYQALVPNLLTLLTQESRAVRCNAVSCLRAIADHFSAANGKKTLTVYSHDSFYGPTTSELQFLAPEAAAGFLSDVVKASHELAEDPEAVKRIVGQLLRCDKKDRSREALNACLISHVLAEQREEPRAALLALADQAVTITKVEMLLPLTGEILARGAVSAANIRILESVARSVTPQVANALFRDTKSGKAHFGAFLKLLAAEEPVSAHRAAIAALTPEFVGTLGPARIQALFSAMLSLVTEAPAETARMIQDAWKRAPPPASLIAAELANARDVLGAAATGCEGLPHKKRRSHRRDGKIAAKLFRLAAVLEMLECKPDRVDDSALIVPLFEVLGAMLNAELVEPPVSTEYIDLLVLSSLTRFVARLNKCDSSIAIDESDIRVDLVVQCIRVTDNPQTHNQALLLMAAVGQMYPNRVLHCIMPVFTFMGANVLRQDDSYSFHVVQQTVEKTIPPLVNMGERDAEFFHRVKSVIKVFVDALFHIPKHRRLRLFTVLVSTLGEDDFLYAVLSLLLEKHAERSLKGSASAAEAAESLLEFCLQVPSQFPARSQVRSLVSLLDTVLALPNDRQPEAGAEVDEYTSICALALEEGRKPPVYDPREHTSRSLRHFKLACVDYACRLLSHKTFAAKVVAAGGAGEDLEKEFLLVIEKALSVIANADTRKYPHREMDENKAASAARFWKGLMENAYRLLDKANSLLSLPAFIVIIEQLMRHQNPLVRRKAIILLTAKAQTQAKFDRETSKLFLSSLRLLCSLIDVSSPDTERVATNAQTALAAIAALAQRLARPHREAFAEVVPLVVGPGGLRSPTPQVAASALVTLAVLVTELGPRVVPFLPKFVPTVLDILKTSAQGANPGVDGVTTVSGLVVLERLVDSLPQFLSPYLDDILSVSLHPALLRTSEAKAFTSEAAEKAKAVRDFLATKVAPRVLLPHVFASYGHAVKCGAESTLALLDVLGNAVTVMPRDVITAQYKKVFKFLLLAFDVRRAHGGQLGEDTSRVEDGAITAFIRLVVKLNESLFKPLFLKTVDWGTVEMAASEEEEGSGDADTGDARARLLFTYRLVSRLLDRLKSIVAPYYACLLENVLGILARYAKRGGKRPDVLWVNVMESLHKCLLHDNDGFWNAERFNSLLPHLAGQLENTSGGADAYKARLSEHIVPCLGQLAVTVGSDALWKPLNSQVLAQTRDDSPLVRTGALRVLSEFYARLGEEFLILLPETIPFLAELMEDDDVEVEKLTQEVIAQMETLLGESLQQYFR